MLLSNITAFRKVSTTSQSEAGFKDENDPEIDRLYNSSPPIEEPYGSFDFEEMITIEVRDAFLLWHYECSRDYI